MEETHVGEQVEFKWGKKRGIGGKKKDVQFYESFSYDNVEYTLYDCVYLYKKGEPEPYIGKLLKVWENSDKTKKVKVLWFFRPCEIQNHLGDEEPLGNELFLASGEGVGLSNINPLESIAGKCNVVCISKDERNPQPSDEEVPLADFVFYRTFDVSTLQILNKIDDVIAGIEVKYIFNRVGLKKSEEVAIGSNKLDAITDTIPNTEQVNFSNGDRSEKEVALRIEDPLVKEESPRGEKPCSGINADPSETDKTLNLQVRASGVKTLTKSEATENTDIRVSTDQQKQFGEDPGCSGVQSEKTTKSSIIQKSNLTKTSFERKDSITESRSLPGEKLLSNGGVKVPQTCKTYEKQDDRGEKATSGPKSCSDKSQEKDSEIIVNEVKDDEGVKNTTDSECRPSKRPKLEEPMKVSDETKTNHSHGPSANTLMKTALSLVDEPKDTLAKSDKDPSKKPKPSEKLSRQSDIRLPKGSHGRPLDKRKTDDHQTDLVTLPRIENDSSKKLKINEKLPTKSDGKLPKASLKQRLDGEDTTDLQVVKMARKPNVDKSRWFKELSWDEKVQEAYTQGALVLLENLDSSFTSAEVKDIVLHGFHTNCTAKMLQRSVYSVTYSGQALVVLNSKDAAQTIVSKLKKGCLVLSNGRPLIGSIVKLCNLGKQSSSSFLGHFAIEKSRVKREMKEGGGATTTSHCSQPNTIEYDMAMEWRLLQEKWDRAREKLNEQQRKEVEATKSSLKLKQ